MSFELYFSVIKIDSKIGAISVKINDPINLPAYIWCIWDIYPSRDVYRPPIFFGTAATDQEFIKIASQYGLQSTIIVDNKHHMNERLNALLNETFTLISYSSKKEKTTLGVWSNKLSFLLGNPPKYLHEKITTNSLHELIKKYSENNIYAGEFFSGYIKNYLARKSAQSEHETSSQSTEPSIVEFVYADHLEKFRGGTQKWKRHRVIKKTTDYIYIERYPFFNVSYITTDWRAHAIYTIKIDRATFEKCGEFYHSTLKTTFYKNQINNKKAKFKTDFFEDQLEVPKKETAWAIKTLKLPEWPLSGEQIVKAYRILAMKHHPDRGGVSDEFIKCKAARDFLLDMLH